MSRTERLRRAQNWSQAQMGDYLGVHQSNISRLEKGEQEESGPVSRLLDQLEASLSALSAGDPSSSPDAPRQDAPPSSPAEPHASSGISR